MGSCSRERKSLSLDDDDDHRVEALALQTGYEPLKRGYEPLVQRERERERDRTRDRERQRQRERERERERERDYDDHRVEALALQTGYLPPYRTTLRSAFLKI